MQFFQIYIPLCTATGNLLLSEGPINMSYFRWRVLIRYSLEAATAFLSLNTLLIHEPICRKNRPSLYTLRKKNYSWFSSDSSMDKSKRSFWVLDQILSAQGLHISSSANKNMRGLVVILSDDENDFFSIQILCRYILSFSCLTIVKKKTKLLGKSNEKEWCYVSVVTPYILLCNMYIR